MQHEKPVPQDDTGQRDKAPQPAPHPGFPKKEPFNKPGRQQQGDHSAPSRGYQQTQDAGGFDPITTLDRVKPPHQPKDDGWGP